MKRKTVELFVKIFSVLKPPPDLSVSTWADRYRKLSGEASAKGGQWNTDNAPYQREIMDAVSCMEVQKIVIMSAAQIGKTEIILNILGYYMSYDPCPILSMQPTLSMAETFSKDRLMPMIRNTPKLRGKISDKARTSGNTIFKKSFPGGRLTMTGANSPTELRGRPIRILLADEVDAYPATAGTEGDPLVLAKKRLTTFWNWKEINVSTPTVKGVSRIEIEYKNSTQEEWNVPCPCCGELQPLKWAQINFDRDEDGEVTRVGHACKVCGVISSEVEWKEHYIEGKYIAKYPNRKVRGFHLNSFASTFYSWEEIVEGFLKADAERKAGNVELMKAWVNTELGETWEEEGKTMEPSELMERRERYKCEVPENTVVITAGVDTQDDRFEIDVVAWAPGHENYGIQYKIIYGDLKQRDIWNRLDDFLLQSFTTEDGRILKIRNVCMDSGGHFTNEVYKFCKERMGRGVFAIKGVGGADKEFVFRPTKGNRQQAYLFKLGVDTGKSLLFQRLSVKEKGPGYCHFPEEEEKGYGETYFKGLTAERQVLRYKKGRPVYEWEPKKQGIRNEPLDCRVYSMAAVEISGVNLKLPDRQTSGEHRKTVRKRRRGSRSGGIV